MTDQADLKDFLAEVRERYVQNPCQVSDLAFWKVAELCQECETHSVHKKQKTYLYAIRDKRLVFYWSDDRLHFLLTPNETKALEFLVLHKDFYKLITNRYFMISRIVLHLTQAMNSTLRISTFRGSKSWSMQPRCSTVVMIQNIIVPRK